MRLIRAAKIALLCMLGACVQEPAAAPEPVAVAPAPARVEEPVAEPTAAAGNPCSQPQPQTITVEAGVIAQTPWGLELTYAIDEDDKRGPGYLFLLTYGDKRWQMRRDNRNWTSERTWRGFCWRGGKRPETRASRLQIEMAPVCKDGKPIELGGCGDVFGTR
jgi:hypothetical protein